MSSAAPWPGPRHAADEVCAGAAADPEREHARVGRLPADEREHRIGVSDLAVGEDDQLAGQLRSRTVEHRLQGRQDLGAAQVGLEQGDVFRRPGQRGLVVRDAIAEQRHEPVAEADDVEARAGDE